MNERFFDRDLSWLSFNQRVLDEASRSTVPILERIKFLSIYSSNLDEFYRVRIPALMALDKISRAGIETSTHTPGQIDKVIHLQQEKFGSILTQQILPELRKRRISVLYDQELPDTIERDVTEYFFQKVAGYLLLKNIGHGQNFFPENNKLYFIVSLKNADHSDEHYIVNIPSDHLPRFYSINKEGTDYILFLDDIIRSNLGRIFSTATDIQLFSFKITRNAELDLKDEYSGNLAKKIEREIAKRDFGLASRFLFQRGASSRTVSMLTKYLKLGHASLVEGGVYHNLKDLASLPLKGDHFSYVPWPKRNISLGSDEKLLDVLQKRELLLHPPYDSYESVIQFFNEAAIDPEVTRIYVTLYRVANNSRIASALCHAAQNGKKVTVFVELKARFDEANNIKWAKKMKSSGVSIISSIPELKVHAKLALIKRRSHSNNGSQYFGILSTGNFNESTAQFYTDHVLLTSNGTILREVERLFLFLKKRKKPKSVEKVSFSNILVAQFNLQRRFMELIDREIGLVKRGEPGSIVIKMNNLEDKVLISKLYEASRSGVIVKLIIRGICCLIPGITGMSENISVIRIVDRYLEHGRIFVFGNNGSSEMFLGSADWMNRNIYRRIEVCFPITNERMKEQLFRMLDYQLSDNQQAVKLDTDGQNAPVVETASTPLIQSQALINAFVNTGE